MNGDIRRARAALVVLSLAVVVAGCGGAADEPTRARPTPSVTMSEEGAPVTRPPTSNQPINRAAATTQLVEAVANNDLDGVKQAIADGANLERRNSDGRTPLVVATKANRVAVARALLEAGADPNAKDNIQDSAFLYAGAEGLNEILEATLAHGADVKSTNRFGGTALIPASEHAHVETVRTLIAAGVPINHINDLGWTAMHEAIVLGNGDRDHATVVDLLLDAGADASIPDGDGVLPRQLALNAGFDEIVDVIDQHQ